MFLFESSECIYLSYNPYATSRTKAISPTHSVHQRYKRTNVTHYFCQGVESSRKASIVPSDCAL